MNKPLEDCPPLLLQHLSPSEADRLATLFRVLGEPSRLQLLSLIAAQPTGEACVCDLVEPLGLSQPTVSHHLKVLYDAGFLRKERRGTWIYYRAVPHTLEALHTALASSAFGASVDLNACLRGRRVQNGEFYNADGLEGTQT